MNKNFAIVLSCAVTVLGLASCGNKETDLLKPESKTHTVVFDAQAPAATETKTALHLQVIPDWRNTDVNDVHIFEKETTTSGSYMMEASRVLMETNDDYTKARFYAEFDNASVIVNPPVMETKASSSQFNYTAIMATREGDKYMVPSVQYPHEQSLIDPKADFLVGGSDETYNETLHEQTFLLDFLRPVALARLAITNLEGTKVNEVKITTANYITGFATYDDVDFENKTVEFQGDESNKVLTLLYPEGKKKTTTFYAYFVCMPGEIKFSEIKVYTDQYVFTKTYASPASLTLKGGDFMNIALDMTPKDGNGVTKTGLDPQTLSFVANDDTVTEIEFDIYEHELGEFIAPTLVIGEDVVDPTKVEVTSSNEEVAVVEVVEGEFVVTLAGGTGEATITATVPGDDTHAAGSASYKIIVTDSTPAPANPKFYKADELVDGQEYIIVSNGMAMTLVEEMTTGTKANVTLTLDAVEVNAVDGVIETDENVAVWTASTQVEYYTGTTAAGHFALKCGDVYLQRHSNQSEQTLIVGDIPTTGKYYVWDYDGEYLSHLSSSTVTFYVGYDNGWEFVYEEPFPETYLYTTTKPLTKQTISFGEQPVTAKYDLNTKEWTVAVPELTGAQTDVTYSSNNDAIEVNATTGAINITDDAKKGDKAKITATAAQTTEYASATASYTIEIIDSTPGTVEETTYMLVTKVDDLVDGNYLIVSHDDSKIYDGSETHLGGYKAVTSEGVSTDATAHTITIADANKATMEFAIDRTDNTIKIQRGETFMAWNSTNDSQASYIAFNETGTSFTLDADLNKATAVFFYVLKNNTNKEYLYYKPKDNGSSLSDAFKIGGSGSSYGVHLYAANRAAQTLEYSKNEVSYDMASGDFTAPTLSGDYHTEVSYTSSKESVATINNEGVVTIKGKGTTTITATAVATADYFSATASYELTVTNSAAQELKYTKVTSVDDLEVEAQYLLVFEGLANDTDGDGDPKVFNPVLKSGDNTQFDKATTSALDVTISDGAIESSDFEDCQFTLEEGYYLFANKAEMYIYPGASGSSSAPLAEATPSHALTITFEDGHAMIKNDTRYIVWSTYSHYFSANTGFTSTNNATYICLYKLDDGRQPQTLSFSASSAKYDKGTSTWTVDVPTLSGAQTNVTYSSSNESVATVTKVDNTTVTVTIASGAKKNDTAVITAIAEADATFKQGKASFTVFVDDSKSVTPEYTLVESSDDIEVGGVYLLVNESNNKVFKPVLASSTSTNFTSAAANAVSATITNHTITSDDFEECELTLEDGYYFYVEAVSRYLYPTSSNIGAEETKSSSHSFSISIASDGIATISRTSGNQTYKLRWTSSSSGYFQSSTSSANCQLYKRQTSGPKKRNLAFSASEVSVNIYGQSLPYAFAGAPTLSGRTDGVTYSVTCSDTNIQQSAYPTVSNTGAVTINGTGVFTIKASAAATTELQAGEASYTLTVTSVAPSTYTLIEGYANLATGTYLIVEKTDTYLFNATNVTTTNSYNQTTTVNNCGYADLNNTTGISKSGNTITLSSDIAEDYEFVFTRTDDNLTIKQVGGTHEGQYMFASSSVSTSFIGFQASAATFVINKKDNTDLIYFSTTKGTSTTASEYLYKKSSDAFFKLGGSGNPDDASNTNAGILLYKKNSASN